MIHIAHIVFSFDVGGLENGIVNLLNHLPRQHYRHSIICLHGYNPDFFARINNANVEIFDLDKQSGKDISYLYRLWKLLRQLQPDQVHSRNLTTLECQLAAWLAGVPQRIHGEHGWDSVDAKTASKPRRLRKLFKPLIHRYIALSGEGQSYLTEAVGVSAKRISRICNGVDTDRFYPRETTNSHATVQIGTVGRLSAVKNQQLVIDSCAELLSQRPELRTKLRFYIIGDGPDYSRLRARIEELQLNDCCTLTGNRNDIPVAMRELDIYIQPSKAEGISNTILEAMASGLPVIATEVGGARELVADRVNGQIIPSEDIEQLVKALERYLDNPDLRLKQGQASRQRALQQFSIKVMTDLYGRVYRMQYPTTALQPE